MCLPKDVNLVLMHFRATNTEKMLTWVVTIGA